MSNKKKVMSGALVVALSGSMLAACADKNAAGTGSGSASDKTPAAASYPIQTKETLNGWVKLNGNLPQVNIQNLNDTAFGKELEKRTGVKVNYTHPAQGQEKEKFNLLIASNDLPDFIEYDWSGNGTSTYPGGPQKAIDDKVILPLNDLIDKYAPNLKKTLQEDKELDKMVKTDSGQYYVFPWSGILRP
ncbi:extracellular solute-binding protein [Paenibacillus sp. P26]|nr:extracellular solute-binding protein [Paenibacillus sp. P26]UUZ89922.1 extracellular solute-binding protein [Paenibacillus sp. P25]